ncbi:MAG: CYTH domain-containing protein, partial [Porticoccaceae bacterium]
MGTETELKLHLSRTALPALRRHPVLAAALRDGNARTLDNTYYDTPGLALRKNGIALRTRRHGRRWWQTVKRAAPATGGLSARPEWEQPYSDTFDFSAIDDGAVR